MVASRRLLRGAKSPPLTDQAQKILAAIIATPGLSIAEISTLTGIPVKAVRQCASETLAYRDLVTDEQAPGRGNSLGAYILRFYPTDKAKAADYSTASPA